MENQIAGQPYFNLKINQNEYFSEKAYIANNYMPFNNPSLPVLLAYGITRQKPGGIFRLQHPYWSIQQLIAGRLKVKINNNVRECSAGDMLLIRAGLPYELSPAGKEQAIRNWVTISNGPLISLLCNLPALTHHVILPLQNPQKTDAIFSQFREAIIHANANTYKQLTILAYSLIVEILTQQPKQISATDFERLLYFLDNHFQQDLSLKELAGIHGCSPRTLQRLFQQNMGMSPMEYLQKLRISHARLLLASSQESIGHIAELCGFHCQSFFTRVFQKHTQMSPKIFRRINSVSNLSELGREKFRKRK